MGVIVHYGKWIGKFYNRYFSNYLKKCFHITLAVNIFYKTFSKAQFDSRVRGGLVLAQLCSKLYPGCFDFGRQHLRHHLSLSHSELTLSKCDPALERYWRVHWFSVEYDLSPSTTWFPLHPATTYYFKYRGLRTILFLELCALNFLNIVSLRYKQVFFAVKN